jgi:hypothetical protein
MLQASNKYPQPAGELGLAAPDNIFSYGSNT